MNGKFIEKYGSTWGDLKPDMQLMAIMSEIFEIRESHDAVRKIVSEVPCVKHTSQISSLEDWRKVCEVAAKTLTKENIGIKQEKMKGSISLKNGIILLSCNTLATIILFFLLDKLLK